ncbi:piggyBac transposable element-derived protein 4-like [Sycon ciliatum]|uniref:piggyBac transposable element-derived protein 4-like n=1 Tax=Sycon ciliatum TaxID=27933 RepID=UPI0031F60E12
MARRRYGADDLDHVLDLVVLDPDSDVEPTLSEDDIVLSEEDGDLPENRAASPGDSENELDDDDVVGDAADDDVGSASSDSDGENEGISAKTHVEAVEALAEGDDGSEGIWVKQNVEPNVPPFTGQPGIKMPLPDDPTPLDYVKLFFTAQFWVMLVTETNRFARAYIDANAETLARRSLARSWTPVTVAEMKVFLGLFLNMGLVPKPELDHYWSTDPIIATPFYSRTMPRERFTSIMNFLHFMDNAEEDPNDKLSKIRPLLTLLQERFMSVYTPNEYISIDEELVAFKGRISFRQYIPSKRARFGMKIYALCEDSGYLFNLIVYVGKDIETFCPEKVKELGVSGAVVHKLVEPLLGKGYKLYVDNWYTSIPIATYLKGNATGVCGTIRKNRIGLPKRIANFKGLKKGHFLYRSGGGMMFIKLQDTKEVHFLSTMHKANVEPTGKRDRQRRPVRKLRLVQDYNKKMGGVDKNDEMLSFYTAARKSRKWYKKLAVHLIEQALLNAYILHRKSNRMTHFDFVKRALKALIAEGKAEMVAHAEAAAAATGGATGTKRMDSHFLRYIPATEKKANPQKQCVVCYGKGNRKDVPTMCADCLGNPGYCIPCFEESHRGK